jgi:hypothetical protein
MALKKNFCAQRACRSGAVRQGWQLRAWLWCIEDCSHRCECRFCALCFDNYSLAISVMGVYGACARACFKISTQSLIRTTSVLMSGWPNLQCTHEWLAQPAVYS